MTSQVHFNSHRPGLFEKALCAAGYMQAILLTCKKTVNLLILFFPPPTLKLCEAVVTKCMYKISVGFAVIAEAVVKVKEIRGND